MLSSSVRYAGRNTQVIVYAPVGQFGILARDPMRRRDATRGADRWRRREVCICRSSRATAGPRHGRTVVHVDRIGTGTAHLPCCVNVLGQLGVINRSCRRFGRPTCTLIASSTLARRRGRRRGRHADGCSTQRLCDGVKRTRKTRLPFCLAQMSTGTAWCRIVVRPLGCEVG